MEWASAMGWLIAWVCMVKRFIFHPGQMYHWWLLKGVWLVAEIIKTFVLEADAQFELHS